MQINAYELEGFHDEFFTADRQPRPAANPLVEWLRQLPLTHLQTAKQAAEMALFDLGATFKVSDDHQAEKRVLPLDMIPRVISAQEWAKLERGLKQRVVALNCFCADIYGEQLILQDGKIPREIVESASGFFRFCLGLKPPGDVWCHVSGVDLVCDGENQWCVLEDNLRVPSGISYVLKNRQVLKSTLPKMFETLSIHPVNDYPQQLLKTLLNSVPPQVDDPMIVVLTPGPNDSAYSEHAFLAEQMGVELVENQDLVLKEGDLYLSKPQGLRRIDVIYRRGDVDLLNALDLGQSTSGIVALSKVCQQGRLAMANTLGTGVADDKVIYAYVPEMIRYYLGEEPLLPNVPTYLCWQDQDRDYVLEHLEELVVKSADEAGGRGMLIGTQATQSERKEFAQRICQQPRNYIAQPTLSLSRLPTMIDDQIEGRHVDLRPFVLHQGDEIHVHPGGLTRVALKKDSLVVNSSQGGGSKDTWVLTA